MKIYRSITKSCKNCKFRLEPDLSGSCLDCMSTYNEQGHYPCYEKEGNQSEEELKMYSNISVPRVTKNF